MKTGKTGWAQHLKSPVMNGWMLDEGCILTYVHIGSYRHMYMPPDTYVYQGGGKGAGEAAIEGRGKGGGGRGLSGPGIGTYNLYKRQRHYIRLGISYP